MRMLYKIIQLLCPESTFNNQQSIKDHYNLSDFNEKKLSKILPSVPTEGHKRKLSLLYDNPALSNLELYKGQQIQL